VLRCISSLCQNNLEAAVRLGQAGCCQNVLSALRRFSRDQVIVESALTAASLLIMPHSLANFATSTGCSSGEYSCENYHRLKEVGNDLPSYVDGYGGDDSVGMAILRCSVALSRAAAGDEDGATTATSSRSTVGIILAIMECNTSKAMTAEALNALLLFVTEETEERRERADSRSTLFRQLEKISSDLGDVEFACQRASRIHSHDAHIKRNALYIAAVLHGKANSEDRTSVFQLY
jgi:hypothetical protein